MYVCICIITLTCYLAMPPYGWERFAHVLMRLILRLLAVDVQALSVLVSIVRGTSALCEKKAIDRTSPFNDHPKRLIW